MDKLPFIARILLGLIFFVFGIGGLFQLIPAPQNLPDAMAAYMGGLSAAWYFFPLLKIVEAVCGALLLLGRYVPLALVILAPVVLHIFLAHLFLAPGGLLMAAVIALLTAYLAFFAKPYSNAIKALFKA